MFEVRGSFISMFFVVLLLPISAVIPQTNSDDYDHDYELIDNSAPVREDGLIPQEDSPAFETDTALNVAEISSSQCLTRERTRVCDCGFQDEVNVPCTSYESSIIQSHDEFIYQPSIFSPSPCPNSPETCFK